MNTNIILAETAYLANYINAHGPLAIINQLQDLHNSLSKQATKAAALDHPAHGYLLAHMDLIAALRAALGADYYTAMNETNCEA